MKTATTNRQKTFDLALLGVFTAIITIMTFIPWLGYIPLPLVSATIIHIPVIVFAINYGPKKGFVLSLIWGILCFLKAWIAPTAVTDPLFMNPFLSILPRLFVGVVAAYAYIGFSRVDKKGWFAIPTAAILGSFTNTVLVVSAMAIFYAKDFGITSLSVVLGVFSTYGVIEALVAAVITLPVAKAVFHTKAKL